MDFNRCIDIACIICNSIYFPDRIILSDGYCRNEIIHDNTLTVIQPGLIIGIVIGFKIHGSVKLIPSL